MRPENQAPTNGRASLWYDIALKENVQIKKAKKAVSAKSPLKLKTREKEIHFNPLFSQKIQMTKSVREGVKTVLLPAGLYLLDSHTFGQIIEHCNQKAKVLKYQESYEKIDRLIRRSIDLVNRFRNKECDIETFMAEANKIKIEFKQIFLSNNMTWPDYFDEYFESLLFKSCDRSGELKSVIRSVISKKEFKLMIGSAISKAEEKFKRNNWDYLNLKGLDTKNALFPILPHELLNFKPL